MTFFRDLLKTFTNVLHFLEFAGIEKIQIG